MQFLDYLDVDENTTSVELGATLLLYGAIIGIGFLMVLIGTTGFFAYVFRDTIIAGGPVIFGLVISVIFGWTGITVAAGGTAYALMQAQKSN